MTGSFIADYYLLVFLASCGLFQMSAAHKGFRGMLFFRHRPSSFLLGLASLVVALAWFFLSEPRNVSDSGHGLNGNEQFAYFFAGSGTGLAFTLIVATLSRWAFRAWRSDLSSGQDAVGLDALKEATYFHAMKRTWGRPRPRLGPNAETPADHLDVEPDTLSNPLSSKQRIS